MMGIGIIMIGAMISISQVFVAVGGPLVPELITDMPTLYEYDDITGEQLKDENGNALTNEKVELYFLLSQVAAVLFLVIGFGAIFVWYVEDYGMARKGAAFSIGSKLIMYTVVLVLIPYVWDVAAIGIERGALFLLDPFEESSPSKITAKLWADMGAVIPPDAFDIEQWGEALSSPGTVGQAIFKNLFLGLFRGIAVMFMTGMMFILSVIRIELTIVIVIAMPIILAFKLVPKFNVVSDMLIKNLVGLMMAPLFSALVITVGIAYLDSENLPAMQEWFSQLAIGFLAVFFPVMLSPMLGFLSTQVGQMMSTMIQGAAMMGGGAASGAMSGISNASAGMTSAADSAGGAAAGAAAGSVGGAAGGSAGARIMSTDSTNGLSSGMTAPNISTMDKFKTYAKAGLVGAIGGAAGGAVSAVGQQMHAPGIGREMSNNINSGIASQAQNMGQNTLVDSSIKNLGPSFAAAAPSPLSADSFATESMQTSMGTTAKIMSAPGGTIDAMMSNSSSFDAGHGILSDQNMQQEFLTQQQQYIGGFDNLPADKQMRFNEGVLNQVNQNPNAAGNMFNQMKSNTSNNGESTSF